MVAKKKKAKKVKKEQPREKILVLPTKEKPEFNEDFYSMEDDFDDDSDSE